MPLPTAWLLLPLLAVAAGASGWLLWQVQTSLNAEVVVDDTSPLLSIVGFQISHTDADGKLDYVISAPHAERLPGNGGSRLIRPRLVTYRDDQTQEWVMQAERGWANADTTLVRLEQNVMLRRLPGTAGVGETNNDTLPLTVATSLLVAWPVEQRLATDQPIRLDSPNGSVSAVGLKGDLSQQRLELLANVKAHYAPP